MTKRAAMTRPIDTSVAAHERQMAMFRAMTPSERLRLADQMSTDVRALSASGDRRRRQQAELAGGLSARESPRPTE